MGNKYEVLQLLYKGKTRKEIAQELWLSPCTIANYQDMIYREEGVHSQKELMAKYIDYLEGVIHGTSRLKLGASEDGTKGYPISNKQLDTWDLRREGIDEGDIPF